MRFKYPHISSLAEFVVLSNSSCMPMRFTPFPCMCCNAVTTISGCLLILDKLCISMSHTHGAAQQSMCYWLREKAKLLSSCLVNIVKYHEI